MSVDIKKSLHALQSIDRWIGALEDRGGKRFKLIYFQSQADRVGHAWEEPSLLVTLYNVEPSEVLLINATRIFSEFCQKYHESVGFTYSLLSEVNDSSDFIDYFLRSNQSEIFYNNRLFVLSNSTLWGMIQNFAIGIYSGSKPLVKSESIIKAKPGVMLRLGIISTRPIIIIHVRESGWVKGGYHDYRNASIENYYSGIEYLLSRGYCVVRIGDKSMRPAEISHSFFYDLPFMLEVEDGDDVALIAMSELYIGQTSGPYSIARLMNKPILLTNEAIPFVGRFHVGELSYEERAFQLVLFKGMIDKVSGKKIDFLERLTMPFYFRTNEYDANNIVLEENTESQILDAVQEAIESISNPKALERNIEVTRSMEFCWALRGLLGRDRLNFGRPCGKSYISRAHYDDLLKVAQVLS